MRIPAHPARALAFLAGWTVCCLAASDAAAQPVYKDGERAGAVGQPLHRPPEVLVEVDRPCCAGPPPAYRRPVNSGPGYVGSVRGLGRPSFDGLWPPPGYGSYRELPTD